MAKRGNPAVEEALAAFPGWRSVVEGRNPRVMGDTVVEILASRWQRSVVPLLERPDDFVQLRYEDFCADKVGAIADTARRLGREGRGDISGMVDRQYGPRGDNSAPWGEFFGPANLNAILQTCGDGMTALGYSV